MKKTQGKESDLKDIVRIYNESPGENERKLKEEEESSQKLKKWILK